MVIGSIINTSNSDRNDNKLKIGLVVIVTIMITVMIPIAVIKSILMVLVEPGSKIRSESRGRRSRKNKAVFIGATMKYKKRLNKAYQK